jgi:hypothetical protein
MGPLVVELFEKIIEFALLLHAVPARGARGLRLRHQPMPRGRNKCDRFR